MIPVDREDVYSAGLEQLRLFGERSKARGRFILLYLGLRRMGSAMAPLASGQAGTGAAELEEFLDSMYLKTHRSEPFVVLTAPFGQSYSQAAPYSTRSGELAPGHKSATNTWRNNFNIQKGIGCPAEPDVIRALLDDPQLRRACPHINIQPYGAPVCRLRNADYRGEMHSIWLRMVTHGRQVVDLNHPAVYRDYLSPGGRRIPIFPLISALYSFAAVGVYPTREVVGIPEFGSDFGFNTSDVEALFECDAESPANAAVLAARDQVIWAGFLVSPASTVVPHTPEQQPEPTDLPAAVPEGQLNTGVGAEIAVGKELQEHGWTVEYFGNQRGVGYDLRATRGDDTMYVEVKSSVGPCTPVLTEEEWSAAEKYGTDYVVAFIDFYGTENQVTGYARDPVATTNVAELQKVSYRLSRDSLAAVASGANSL